jgi:hypothetical protein
VKFYRIKSRQLWGDYGSILVRGMTDHLGRKDGLVQLERTAPFVPSLSFPGLHDVVATDDFRKRLESSRLGPLQFRPVIKARIVEYHWHNWDLHTEEPKEFPDGEPADYILARPHSPKMTTQIGDIWEVELRQGAHVELIGTKPYREIRIIESTWNADHFFLAKNPDIPDDFGLYTIVTDTGKAWLEEHTGDWVRFEEIAVR